MFASPSELQREAARHVVTKYLRVRSGENAIIESWAHTLPMAAAMLDEVRRAGGKPLLVYNDEDSWWREIDRGRAKRLGQAGAPEWAALRAADVYVNFWGPGDSERLEKLPDSADPAFDWNWPWYDVARKARLRGVRMTAGFATEGRARRWGLDAGAWQESFLRATLADPTEMARAGARLKRALSRGKTLRIRHANGTDLELGLAGVPPRVQDGRPHPWTRGASRSGMLTNVPGGSVDCVLDSRSAEGRFRANRRTNIWWNWHAGGSLEFRDGKLVSYSLDEGGPAFARQYRQGSAGRDRASAVTIGLNPAIVDVPHLEKWEGGCVSLQIGGNRGLGGTNGSTFFSWFSLAGTELAVDGTPVVRDGTVL